MEESQDGLRSLLCRIEKAALKVRQYQVNEDKTEYMIVGWRDTITLYPTSNVNDRTSKRTKRFKYLKFIINRLYTVRKKWNQPGNKCFSIWCCNIIFHINKTRNYLLSCDTETQRRKGDGKKLVEWERKIFWNDFGPVKERLNMVNGE